MNARPLAPAHLRRGPSVGPGPTDSQSALVRQLALWLADVSAEAALAQDSAEAGGTLVRTADAGSTAVEAT